MLQRLATIGVFTILEEYLLLLECARYVSVCKGLPSKELWSYVRDKLDCHFIVVSPHLGFGAHIHTLFRNMVEPLLAIQTDAHTEESCMPDSLEGRQIFVRVRGYQGHRWIPITHGMTLRPTRILKLFRNRNIDSVLWRLQVDGTDFRATQVVTYYESGRAVVKMRRCRLQAQIYGFEVELTQRSFHEVSGALPDSD